MTNRSRTRPVTIIVEWIGGEEDDPFASFEFPRQDFLRSLGLNPDLWDEPQVARLNAGTTFTIFGMELQPQPAYSASAEWRCRFEVMAEGCCLFAINGIAVAVNLKNAKSRKPLSSSLVAVRLKDRNIKSLPRRFSELKNLTSLNLCKCNALADLGGLSGLSKLTSLDLCECESLTDLSGLAGLSNLTSLNLGDGNSLDDLSVLAGLSKLTSLVLSQHYSLTDLSALSGMSKLVSLDLSGAKFLKDLSALSGLLNLTSLDLNGCYSLTDLSPLSGLRKLTRLDLTGCEALSDLNALSGLTNLMSLRFGGCPYLNTATRIKPLLGLHRLEQLDLNAPDLRLQVLLSAAHARADSARLQDLLNKEDAIIVLQRSSNATELAACIAKALGMVGDCVITVGEGTDKEHGSGRRGDEKDDAAAPLDISEQVLLEDEESGEPKPESKANGEFVITYDMFIAALTRDSKDVKVSPDSFPMKFLSQCRNIPDITGEGWCEIIREVGKGAAAPLAAWLNGLVESSELALSPVSGLLDYIAESGQVEGVNWPALLDPVLEKVSRADQIELGPQICLAWRVLGEGKKERFWLNALTGPEGRGFRSKVRAKFALHASKLNRAVGH
jgi:hypothetical protein